MKFPVILPILAFLAALVIARPMPQTCTSPNARRDPQLSTTVSIGTILTSDPCFPSSFQTSALEASRQSTAASIHAVPESFFSWLHNVWNKIRNAIKNISIKITIPWNVLEGWLNKLANGWTLQTDPDDDQAVDLIPSADAAKAGAQMIKWTAPEPVVVSRPPVNKCGVATAPGKPVKECP